MLSSCLTLRVLVIGLWDPLFCFSFSQSIKPEHDNDIYISGYSDAILRYAWLSLFVQHFYFNTLLKHWNIDISFTLTFALCSFRFIAERGEGGQLIHVEKIDEAFHLKPLAGAGTENVKSVPSSDPERPLSLLSGKPRYNVFHVFKHFS